MLDVEGEGMGGGGVPIDCLNPFPLSRDLLRLRKSFAKFLTDILDVLVDTPGSSCSASAETAESAENLLDGCGKEKVRVGGSSTPGVAGLLLTEINDTLDVRDGPLSSSKGSWVFRFSSEDSIATDVALERVWAGEAEDIPETEGETDRSVLLGSVSSATRSNGTDGHLESLGGLQLRMGVGEATLLQNMKSLELKTQNWHVHQRLTRRRSNKPAGQ